MISSSSDGSAFQVLRAIDGFRRSESAAGWLSDRARPSIRRRVIAFAGGRKSHRRSGRAHRVDERFLSGLTAPGLNAGNGRPRVKRSVDFDGVECFQVMADQSFCGTPS